MIDAYLVCATPRTGSTLLGGLLASSGVAGYPQSYFRAEDEETWASRFGIDGGYEYLDFVRRAQERGTTDNGVFAARVMWGTLTEIVDKLQPSIVDAESDLELLRGIFGDLRFVYLWRDDEIAQAVSWARAEQTNVWHAEIDGRRVGMHREPAFDRGQIADLAATIDSHNHAWRDWFASVGVQPHQVRYEDLARDPVPTARGVLTQLGIDAPAAPLEVRDEPLGDRLNVDWISRYRDGA